LGELKINFYATSLKDIRKKLEISQVGLKGRGRRSPSLDQFA